MSHVNIAIDGPSGAGKSTIAKIISRETGYIYLDTGALYRTVGLYVKKRGISSKDTEKIISVLPDVNIDIQYISGTQRLILNGEDVTDFIRTPEISIYASDISAIKEVRAFLLDLQREQARTKSVIMDGRDIGTVVLPNADIKIFLTATVEDRANRRFAELKIKNPDISYDEVLSDMKYRDYNDSHRDIAPLKQADDAILIDTTGNELEKSIEIIKNVIKERLK